MGFRYGVFGQIFALPAMPTARLAVSSDSDSLLALFAASEVIRAAKPREHAERVWVEILTHPNVHVFVSDERDCIAATCMLVTAPNLLRGGRRHGFLENVVTHPDFRSRGHGRCGAGRAHTNMGEQLPPGVDAERACRPACARAAAHPRILGEVVLRQAHATTARPSSTLRRATRRGLSQTSIGRRQCSASSPRVPHRRTLTCRP
jgi:hypothetical protein